MPRSGTGKTLPSMLQCDTVCISSAWQDCWNKPTNFSYKSPHVSKHSGDHHLVIQVFNTLKSVFFVGPSHLGWGIVMSKCYTHTQKNACCWLVKCDEDFAHPKILREAFLYHQDQHVGLLTLTIPIWFRFFGRFYFRGVLVENMYMSLYTYTSCGVKHFWHRILKGRGNTWPNRLPQSSSHISAEFVSIWWTLHTSWVLDKVCIESLTCQKPCC